MIFRENGGAWSTAHATVIQHYQICFDLLVQAGLREGTLPYAKALALLTFKEPREFCLGYTQHGTSGAGGGPGYARLIARAMVEAVNRGLRDLNHFEELGILEKGIGSDRIADLTCNILKFQFIEYTKQIAVRHGLPTATHTIESASFDARARQWVTESHQLPTNPYSGLAVLLTPQQFIRNRPVLDAADWFDHYQNEQARTDLSYEVLTNVTKETIVAAARQNAQMVRDWTEQQAREAEPQPYDLENDPDGVYRWDSATRDFVRINPLSLQVPQTTADFLAVIERVLAEFRRYIEEQRGWSLLWNEDGTEKLEEAAQLVFLGIARSYCAQNNIVVDREVELGRGPVNFKFSNGYIFRALIEVKKLHSGAFWSGLERQLPSYLESDDCQYAWYMAIQYRTGGVSRVRGPRLPSIIDRIAQRTNKDVKFFLVDATKKASASNL